jgi:hypothetical protein
MVTVAQMTSDQLRDLITSCVEDAVERRLTEILGDPDEGLEVRDELAQRLSQQQQRFAAGERGRPMNEILRELGWEQ